MCVVFFPLLPANRRVYATKSRRTEDRRRSKRKIWARSGRRDLDTSLKVEYHRAQTTGQEYEGTLSALRKDDKGRLTGAVAKR